MSQRNKLSRTNGFPEGRYTLFTFGSHSTLLSGRTRTPSKSLKFAPLSSQKGDEKKRIRNETGHSTEKSSNVTKNNNKNIPFSWEFYIHDHSHRY